MDKILKYLKRKILRSSYGPPIFFIIIYIATISTTILFLEYKDNDQFKHMFDAIWWTIVTFSTTGYGDKVPVTIAGKIIAVITILTGVGLVSFLSGTMASVFIDRSSKARRGLMDFKDLKNHIIICGWKNPMNGFLKELIRFNRGIHSEDVVIVSNIEPEKMEDLRKEDVLKDLKFVKGDYFEGQTLKRANLKAAKKVMILADTYESEGITEVDSKTVMTVLTAKNISKDVYVCAELLDKKYEMYLKQAMCDEIHFSMDHNRTMLGNASANNGITHIFYELIGHQNSKTKLTTKKIDKKFIEKPYSDLKNEIITSGSSLLIGLLENTGTPRKLKKEALRDAQKTANISLLIENLQHVKDIELNNPVLLPDDDYVIRKHSEAIIVEKQ